MTLLIVALSAPFVVWLASHLVEALRREPQAPNVIPWDAGLSPTYVMVKGTRLRYVKYACGRDSDRRRDGHAVSELPNHPFRSARRSLHFFLPLDPTRRGGSIHPVRAREIVRHSRSDWLSTP